MFTTRRITDAWCHTDFGPPTPSGPSPSLAILDLLQLRQETHPLRGGRGH